ncbi:Retrovirus-related Pol polyprotein from transposon [Tetrabaena socialis]|uniref:Retrovirus-related Pol polyprotein from transposon n=1 Tax=Tetrabaena socialis TaxID=47790 RepID=A0A2J8ADI8_9CHLO|nr:Retrovirus-related Pol polyprotein from transposon [Tetrabaena socialis]|eukprot:PNH10576.1 Retrovirus-related Pol polyprotein from transposon [Tetrabaena socialis]
MSDYDRHDRGGSASTSLASSLEPFLAKNAPLFVQRARAEFIKMRGRNKFPMASVPIPETMELLQGLPIPLSSLDVWWLDEEPAIVAAATAWYTAEQLRKGAAAAAILPLDGQTLFTFYLSRLDTYFAKDRKNEALLNFKKLRQAKDGSPSMFLRAMKLLEPQLGGAIPPESFATNFISGLEPEVRSNVMAKYVTVPREDWYNQLSAIAADADVVWSNVQHERLNRPQRSGADDKKKEKEEAAPPPAKDRGPRQAPPSASAQRGLFCEYHGLNRSHATADCYVLQQQGSGQTRASPRASRPPSHNAALMSLLQQLLPQGGGEVDRSVLASSSGDQRPETRSRAEADRRPGAAQDRRPGASAGAPNRAPLCSYCSRPGHDADSCLIKHPHLASEGWLPPGELLRAQFLANKKDTLSKAPSGARKSAAASVKTAEEQEEGYESEFEDDYRSTHSHAHVSFAHTSASTSDPCSDAVLTPNQALLIRQLRVSAFIDRTHNNCGSPGGAAVLSTQADNNASGHAPQPSPNPVSNNNSASGNRHYPLLPSWFAPGMPRPRPLPTHLPPPVEALATLTAQQVPITFEPSEVKPDVYPPRRLPTRPRELPSTAPVPEATVSFPLCYASLPLLEAVLAYSQTHVSRAAMDACNSLLAEVAAKLRGDPGPETSPPARTASSHYVPPQATFTAPLVQPPADLTAMPASQDASENPQDPLAALASDKTTHFMPLPHAMRQGAVGSVSYTISGSCPSSRSLHQIPDEEMPDLLAANLAAAGYFKDKQYMFYYPSGGIALKGHHGKLAALRDQCANTNLMTASAARRLGFTVIKTSTRLTSSSQPDSGVLGEVDTLGIKVTLLPGTPHAVDLPLMQTLVVPDSPLFDYLVGNEQMRSVADYVTQYPTARLHFKPNIVVAPGHTLAMPMTKGPESKSALAARHVTFCTSTSDASESEQPNSASASAASFAGSGYSAKSKEAFLQALRQPHADGNTAPEPFNITAPCIKPSAAASAVPSSSAAAGQSSDPSAASPAAPFSNSEAPGPPNSTSAPSGAVHSKQFKPQTTSLGASPANLAACGASTRIKRKAGSFFSNMRWKAKRAAKAILSPLASAALVCASAVESSLKITTEVTYERGERQEKRAGKRKKHEPHTYACKARSWTGLLTFALTLFLLSSFTIHVGATHAQNTGVNGVTLTSQLLATGGLLCSSAAGPVPRTAVPGLPNWPPPPASFAAALASVDSFSFDGTTAVSAYEKYHKDEDGGWVWGNSQHLSVEQQASLQAVVRQRKHSAFAYSMEELPGYCGDQGPFRLDLNTSRPIVQPPRRCSPTEKQVILEKTEELVKAGIVYDHVGPTICAVNPVVAAKKCPDTGLWTQHRMAQDYRSVNSHTPHDQYGMHRPEDIFQQVGKARMFSKLDLRQGFLQIPISPEDQAKTAYWVGNKLVCYNRMPYGLKNASAKFQRVMDYEISKSKLDHCAISFIDDVLIWSDTPEQHEKDVAAVLDMLHACGPRAHPDKSIFGADVIEYLGHNLSTFGISPHQAKVAAIMALQPPKNVSELRTQLGFINYYRCYCPQMSRTVADLNKLLKKGEPWTWGPGQQAAHQAIKDIFAQEGLVLRRVDYSRPLVLHTDFSNKGIAAVLGQLDDDGNEYMCACISRSLNKHESNYCSYKGEMLAAVWAIKAFRHHLIGGPPFKLVTDHQPLLYLMSSEGLTGQYARFALSLQEYNFTVEHRPGDKHQNADTLSRHPQETTADNTGARLDEDSDTAPADSPRAVMSTLGILSARHDCAALKACLLSAKLAAPFSESMLPSPEEALLGWNGWGWEQFSPPPDSSDEMASIERKNLRGRALEWRASRRRALRRDAIPPTGSAPAKPTPSALLGSHFFDAALKQGITLYEPLGGLCEGLEACLRINLRGEQWLVVAYWAQGDTARQQAALSTIDLLRQAQPGDSTAFLLGSYPRAVAATCVEQQGDDALVCSQLGPATVTDAARFGSHAHRLYRSWSSLADPEQLGSILRAAARPACSGVQSILETNHQAPLPGKLLRPPFYPCNTLDSPVKALHPGAVGIAGSGPCPSACFPLYNVTACRYEPPSANECELILGLPAGCTKRHGLSELQRLEVLQSAVDQHYLAALLAAARVLADDARTPAQGYALFTSSRLRATPAGHAAAFLSSNTDMIRSDTAALASEQVDRADAVAGDKLLDIWDDVPTLHLFNHGVPPGGLEPSELRRAIRRARRYRIQGNQLLNLAVDGKSRQVPRPPDRVELIKRTHEETGHFGARRTLALLLTSYWWSGISQDVTSVVRHCGACDRVNASFTAQTAELNPLPLAGLFYRWGVDLCGPFNRTARGNTYVMVLIEHFSKYVLLVPIPDKHADQTAFVFLHHVLGRYGACAEVCTDQGSEFKGEFAALLADSLIDHRQTSANHPQANGLAERAVRTCKTALRRIGLSGGGSTEWDKHLAYVMLGYNCSVQESTRCSPYALMHATEPTIPPAVKPKFAETVNLDDTDTAAKTLLLRSTALRRNIATAGGNLLIAQHRDTLRYARMRGGASVPRLRRFEMGDYVYYRNTSARTSLDAQARPQVLRVVEVRPTGVLLLEGKCGSTMTAHVSHCAPCHLPIDSHAVDPRLARPSPNHPCEVCTFPDGEEWMLLCDACGKGWHTYCLTPALNVIPDGTWICPQCVDSGMTVQQVEARSLGDDARGPLPPKHLSALQGAQVMREPSGRKGRTRRGTGVASYSGLRGRSHLFSVAFDDGSSELLSVPQLRSRLTKPAPDKARPKRALAASAAADWDFTSLEKSKAARLSAMPGDHTTAKAHALFDAAGTQPPAPVQAIPSEVAVLLDAVQLCNMGTVFLPWNWGGGVHTAPASKRGLAPVMPGAFEAASASGVRMDAVCAHVNDAVADVLLPLAAHWANVVTVARVSPSYIRQADPARSSWLRRAQGAGLLSMLACDTCLWILVFRSPELRRVFMRDAVQIVTLM